MKQIRFTIFLLFFSLVFFSCKKNPITPNQDNYPLPGRRDYTWKVDSLCSFLIKSIIIILGVFYLVTSSSCKNYPTSLNDEEDDYLPGSRDYKWSINLINENAPLNSYTKLFGITPTDIWIIGSAGDFDKTILRYDGININNYGQIAINPLSVFGKRNDEIWFSGREFDIWKYDGNAITLFSKYNLDNYCDSFLDDIWGIDSENIFAVGSMSAIRTGEIDATIMKYDGFSWEYAIAPIPHLQFIKIRKAKNNSLYYLLAVQSQVGSSDPYKFYSFDGVNVFPFYLPNESNTIHKNLGLLDDFIYFIDNKEIYKLKDDKAEPLISLKNTNVNGTKFWGRNEKDFFIQTQDGIGHFNGSDLKTLFDIEGDFGIIDGLIFDNDQFFVGFYKSNFKFFLIHGKR